jgi:hypothetical protein
VEEAAYGEGKGVIEARKGPLLLLGADDDIHRELLLLGELGRDIEVLDKLGRTELVVHDVADHVIGVFADYPTIIDQAGDLAGDPWRRWRMLLGLDTDAFLIVLLLVVPIFIVVVIVRGRLWHPLSVLDDVAEEAGAPFGVPIPGRERVPVCGCDGVGRVTSEEGSKHGSAMMNLLDAFRPFLRDRWHSSGRFTSGHITS